MTRNIAYILGRFPVISETFIGNEIRAMEALGHKIFPIALHSSESNFQPEDAELEKRTLYFSPIGEDEAKKLLWQYLLRFHRIIFFVLRQTSESYFPLLVHAAFLANHLRKNQCTHVHAHFGWGATTYAIAAAKLLKLPVTFTCHGSDVYARPIDLKLKCKTASAVFAVAPTIASDIRKIAGRTPCHLVYCGVDITRFRPLQELSQKHDRWLFLGRLTDCKGIDDILAAWAELPPGNRPPLDIVGDGSLREKLRLYAVEHGFKEPISFLGNKSSYWIAENGPRYRAFVSAFRKGSDGSQDTAPMVLKEAMAMALPIVTTNFMDIPEIVGEECSVICPVSSPAAIAKAVLHIQGLSGENLQEMGSRARARAEKYFSLKQQAERLTELIVQAKSR